MDVEITTIQLEKICRLCLQEGNIQYLYTELTVDEKTICLSQMLSFCLSVQISENDGLPSQICTSCYQDILGYYKFKQKCIKSEETLRHYISSKTEIKIEEIYIDDRSEGNDEEFASDEKELKKEPKYSCKRCELNFASSTELENHRETVKHPRKRNHTCSVCQKTFTHSQLRVHMRSHTKEKPFNCEVCGKNFSLNCNLRRHMMTHSGERPHKCNLCGKGFIQSTSLQEHLRVHSGQTPFICSCCGKAFTQSGQLRMHSKLHEDEADDGSISEYQCDVCDRKFQKRSVLNTHKLIHGEKSFLCSECGRGFATRAGLQSHSKVHTGLKPFACQTCGKAFSQLGSLKSHRLIHTGQKPFACPVCSKAFKQRNHLKYHLRIHSGERPYACAVCGKRFALNGTLTVHKRTHTGETPYLCPVCGKGFYDSSSMKKHHKGHNLTLAQLSELLQSAHLEVRLAAGEAFALIFELGREFNDDFAEEFSADLVETLRQLATDSHKYRAKKDRKQQRATFRDILHYIEEDLFTDIQVRFGQEALVLDSWSRRKQYEVVCQTLGSGLNLHLAENDLLREIFQLGARVLQLDGHGVKQSKLERHLMNAANFKARTISRSKNRDKRSAVLAC